MLRAPSVVMADVEFNPHMPVVPNNVQTVLVISAWYLYAQSIFRKIFEGGYIKGFHSLKCSVQKIRTNTAGNGQVFLGYARKMARYLRKS